MVVCGCELDCQESRALKNWCFWTVVLEKTLESPLDCKEIQPVHSEGGQPWDFFGRNDAKAETPIVWSPHAELTHWKRPRCWEGLGAGGEGDDRGWDGWMASQTPWTWVWVNPGSWWWTGRPGVLRFMCLQRIRHDWATELNYFIQNNAFWDLSMLLYMSVVSFSCWVVFCYIPIFSSIHQLMTFGVVSNFLQTGIESYQVSAYRTLCKQKFLFHLGVYLRVGFPSH